MKKRNYDKMGRDLSNVSKEDVETSATINLFRSNKSLFLSIMKRLYMELPSKERMHDLGCGYGGL